MFTNKCQWQMTTAISIEDVRREVKILKSLSGHKHMIRFHDAFEDANNVYIVMEYVYLSCYFYLEDMLIQPFIWMSDILYFSNIHGGRPSTHTHTSPSWVG